MCVCCSSSPEAQKPQLCYPRYDNCHLHLGFRQKTIPARSQQANTNSPHRVSAHITKHSGCICGFGTVQNVRHRWQCFCKNWCSMCSIYALRKVWDQNIRYNQLQFRKEISQRRFLDTAYRYSFNTGKQQGLKYKIYV